MSASDRVSAGRASRSGPAAPPGGHGPRPWCRVAGGGATLHEGWTADPRAAPVPLILVPRRDAARRPVPARRQRGAVPGTTGVGFSRGGPGLPGTATLPARPRTAAVIAPESVTRAWCRHVCGARSPIAPARDRRVFLPRASRRMARPMSPAAARERPNVSSVRGSSQTRASPSGRGRAVHGAKNVVTSTSGADATPRGDPCHRLGEGLLGREPRRGAERRDRLLVLGVVPDLYAQARARRGPDTGAQLRLRALLGVRANQRRAQPRSRVGVHAVAADGRRHLRRIVRPVMAAGGFRASRPAACRGFRTCRDARVSLTFRLDDRRSSAMVAPRPDLLRGAAHGQQTLACRTHPSGRASVSALSVPARRTGREVRPRTPRRVRWHAGRSDECAVAGSPTGARRGRPLAYGPAR